VADGGDIEVIALIVLMDAAKSAQADLRLIMSGLAKVHVPNVGSMKILGEGRFTIGGAGTFQNDGLLNVPSGTFQVGAGSITGSFQVACAATLDFVGGYSLDAGTTITGGGLVEAIGAPFIPPNPIVVAAPVSIPNLAVGSGGLLSVQAPLTVASPL